MEFTRTASGVSNYPDFVNSDIVAYVEGSIIEEDGEENFILDRHFYLALLSTVFNNKSITVKCVGNKSAALAYVNPIINSRTKRSVVIVDRDYDGLHCSLLEHPALVYTYGYSWENDLWTEGVAQAVLGDLMLNNVDSSLALKKRYSNGLTRLRTVSILDAALQADSQTIFQKNGGGCGIQIDGNSPDVISRTEVSRLTLKFKENPSSGGSVVKAMLKAAKTIDATRVIQGHLWANLVLKIVTAIYKSKMKGGMLPHKVIENLALTKFACNPKKYLSKQAYEYYTNELTRKVAA